MWGIPKIVLERLKGSTVGNQDNRQSAIENRQFLHPDANLLTAFLEGRLAERERTQVLSHLSECAECREIAAMALPAEAEAAEPARLPVRSGWSVRPLLRWGVFAAALGAVVVVAVFRQPSRSRVQTASNNTPPSIVANASEAPRPAPQPLPAQLPTEAATRTAGSKSRESAGEMRKKRVSPPQAYQIAPLSPGIAGALTPPRAQLRPSATPAAPPRISQSAALSTAVNNDLISRAAQPSAVMNHPPVPAYDNRSLAGGTGASMAMRANALQAKLPEMAFRSRLENAVARSGALWTISPEGKLQRSEDSGKNWEEVRVDDKVQFRVVQANGREIWAGGTAGALYHSSDGGATWQRIRLASGDAVTRETVVVIDCSPSDLQHITVKSASGAQWISDDGGQHWSAVTSDE